MTSLSEPKSSRRELNKVATREAIANAALDFLRHQAFNTFTVDDVAAAAGVSRRTFFNYYPSVEAAVASFTQNYLTQVILELERRPADEPMLESAEQALLAAGSTGGLGILAETFGLTQDPALGRFQLQAWEECTSKLLEVARRRLPAETDELYIQALVGAVIGSCKNAFHVWFARHGRDVSPSSLADLQDLLQRTIALLNSGFSR